MSPPSARFLVAYVDGAAAACGTVRRLDDGTGEIKRMYVRPQARGQGLARRLLAELEAAARGSATGRAVLDTGDTMPDAQAALSLPGIPRGGRLRRERLGNRVVRAGAGVDVRAVVSGYTVGRNVRATQEEPVRDEPEGQLDTPDARAEGTVAADETADAQSERERLQEGEERGTSAGAFEPDATSAGAEPPH